MSGTLQKLKDEISELQPSEKTELLRQLVRELDEAGESTDAVRDAWIAEAQRRYEELASGKATAVPADEVFKRIRERLKK